MGRKDQTTWSVEREDLIESGRGITPRLWLRILPTQWKTHILRLKRHCDMQEWEIETKNIKDKKNTLTLSERRGRLPSE